MESGCVKIIKETETLFGEKSMKEIGSSSVKIDKASYCYPSLFKYFLFWHGYSEMGWNLMDYLWI